jgi:hypothetical protein
MQLKIELRMKDKAVIEEFIESKEIITRRGLVTFLRGLYPEITESNLNWKIQNITRQFGLARYGYSMYIKSSAKLFLPQLFEFSQIISDYISTNFPEIKFSIFDTRNLNQLTLHQLTHFIILIETEKGVEQSLLDFLVGEFPNVFPDPNEREYLNFVVHKTDPVIVRSGFSQAPLITLAGVNFPGLEKLLIDLVAEPTLYMAVQGNELYTIFRNATEDYIINFSKLFRYAKRRGVLEKVQKILIEINSSKYSKIASKDEFRYDIK